MAKITNMAMLAKLGWRVLTQTEVVWCKLLRLKYGTHEEDCMQLRVRHRASHIWKGITWSSSLFRSGLKGRVGDRRMINKHMAGKQITATFCKWAHWRGRAAGDGQ